MLKKIKQEKSDLLNDQEKSQIFGGECSVKCACNLCGEDFRLQDANDNAG